MKYRLKRNRALAFQNFQDAMFRAEQHLPELESSTVPHYSEFYAADDLQDLANQLEFKSEAGENDEVLDEEGRVVGKIYEEMAMPVLRASNGRDYAGPEVRGLGDPSGLDSEEYAKKMVDILNKKH